MAQRVFHARAQRRRVFLFASASRGIGAAQERRTRLFWVNPGKVKNVTAADAIRNYKYLQTCVHEMKTIVRRGLRLRGCPLISREGNPAGLIVLACADNALRCWWTERIARAPLARDMTPPHRTTQGTRQGRASCGTQGISSESAQFSTSRRFNPLPLLHHGTHNGPTHAP